jgi:ABC-type Zn uptake system ZnuABC Zn-binding protein ZnuA
MKTITFLLALLGAAAFLHSSAEASEKSGKKLMVIASIPDFADMAREIGGTHVTVESMANGTEDVHAVAVRPSLAARLARADVLIEMGLENEHAWLPPLVEVSNNQKIQPGRQGDIIASEGVVPKDVPTNVGRKEGEQHPGGNPHVNLGPDMGRLMAQNIAKGLTANAPEYKADFEANLAKYIEKLDAKEREWKAAAAKLKGVKFVSHHPDMAYFSDYLGLEEIGTVEPKPGIPPSSSHTAALIEEMKAKGVKIVIREPQYSEKLANEIAAKTGAKVVKLTVMVGGVPEAKTWIDMIDYNIKAMLDAIKG